MSLGGVSAVTAGVFIAVAVSTVLLVFSNTFGLSEATWQYVNVELFLGIPTGAYWLHQRARVRKQ